MTDPCQHSPRLIALLVAALLALPSTAWGWFVCITKDGHTYNDEKPPPECKDVPVKEMNPDGSLKRIIPPPETPAQRAARETEEKEQRKREKQDEQRRNEIRRLLQYESADAIEAARLRALAGPFKLIDHAKQRLRELDNEHKRWNEEAEFYVNRPMPDDLKQKVRDNDDERAWQKKAIDDANGEIRKINTRFDSDRDRFLELVKDAAGRSGKK
jgi:hypothetical protein